MIIATNSSGGGALGTNFDRNRMCPRPLNVTVVQSLLAGRLFMTSAIVSSTAWLSLRLRRALNAASLL
eukprot:5664681-Heterocapsa_arctica.AAC.1